MTTFKVLTFGPINKLDKSYVDEHLLSKGIYSTSTPGLHSSERTIENLIEIHKYVFNIKEDDEWIENIRQCQLTEVRLVLV